MRLTSESKRTLLAEMRSQMGARGWNTSNLAEACRINQGQASRILNGKFKTLSSNVMRICIELRIEPVGFGAGNAADGDGARVANSALSIWNGTREDAELLGSLFQIIADLRKTGRLRR